MNNNNLDNLGFFDILTLFSVFLQVASLQSNLKQASTDDLMEELQRQDRKYLDKIIENQNKILEYLSNRND